MVKIKIKARDHSIRIGNLGLTSFRHPYVDFSVGLHFKSWLTDQITIFFPLLTHFCSFVFTSEVLFTLQYHLHMLHYGYAAQKCVVFGPWNAQDTSTVAIYEH